MSFLKKVSALYSIIIIASTFCVTKAIAQEYKYEFGGASGISCYMGDANKTNIFYKPGINGSLFFRYNLNLSLSVKGSLSYSLVKIELDKNDVNFFSNELKMRRSIFELGGQIECNLIPYSEVHSYMGSKPYTPYLFVGLGLAVSPNGSGFISPTLPVGVGFKYKLSSQLNLGVEFSMRKLFSDKLDTIGNKTLLDSPFDIKSSFLKNKDWYSFTMLSISWSFGERCNPCD